MEDDIVLDEPIVKWVEMNFGGFPKTLWNMIETKTLDLTYNHIPSIPSGIKALTKLTTLLLANNVIVSIPSAFSALTNLR